MNDVIAAALRWHAASEIRLAASAAKRRVGATQKNSEGFLITSYRDQAEAADQLTLARRAERRALKQLAKACVVERDDLRGAPDVETAANVRYLTRRK